MGDDDELDPVARVELRQQVCHVGLGDQPSTGLAALVCACYVVATLGAAVVLISRRDA